MSAEYHAPYAPERCTEHGPLCPGAAGGDHIDEPVTFVGGPFISKSLDATRCVICGHRLDDMGGCDSCAGDREAAEWDRIEHDEERHPELVEGCSDCDDRAERVGLMWERMTRAY